MDGDESPGSGAAKRARLAVGALAELSDDDQFSQDNETTSSSSSSNEDVATTVITNASSSSKGGKVSHECICGKTFAAAMQLAGHKGRCDVYAQAKHGAPYARNEIDRSKRLAKVSVPNGMNLVPVEPLSQGLMQLKNTTASDQELRSGNDTNNFDNQEGDMGESRNNLYWNHKLCEACLWYGSDEVGRHDMMEVLPLFQEVGGEDIIVKRADIVPLDGVFCQKYQDEHHRAFCLALLDFPEWDDNQRVSYVWSSTIIAIMNQIDEYNRFRGIACSLGLDEGAIFGNNLKKMYLFALCALHSGFLEDCTASTLLGCNRSNDDNDRYHNDEDGILDRSKTTADICELYKTIVKLKDSEDKHFRRSASRCGSDFQVSSIPPECPAEEKVVYFNKSRAEVEAENDDENQLLEACRIDGLVHSAVILTPQTMEIVKEYVNKVIALPLVLPGCFVCMGSMNSSNSGANYEFRERQDIFGIVTRIRFSDSGPSAAEQSSIAERILDAFQDVNSITPSEIKNRAKNIILTIYDGSKSFSATVSDVKVCGKLVDIDTALEIVRNVKYDMDAAFVAVFDMYKKALAQPTEFCWNKSQFDSYLNATKTVKKDDAWKCYQQYKKNYKKKIASGDIGSGDDMVLKGIEVEKSFKVIFDVYERMNHERRRREDNDDEGHTLVNVSKTYMSQDSQDSQTSSLALPSPRQKSFSGNPSPIAKLKTLSPATVPLPNDDDEEDEDDGNANDNDDMELDTNGDENTRKNESLNKKDGNGDKDTSSEEEEDDDDDDDNDDESDYNVMSDDED